MQKQMLLAKKKRSFKSRKIKYPPFDKKSNDRILKLKSYKKYDEGIKTWLGQKDNPDFDFRNSKEKLKKFYYKDTLTGKESGWLVKRKQLLTKKLRKERKAHEKANLMIMKIEKRKAQGKRPTKNQAKKLSFYKRKIRKMRNWQDEITRMDSKKGWSYFVYYSGRKVKENIRPYKKAKGYRRLV
jgi:hypothetical protein